MLAMAKETVTAMARALAMAMAMKQQTVTAKAMKKWIAMARETGTPSVPVRAGLRQRQTPLATINLEAAKDTAVAVVVVARSFPR